MPRAVIAVAVVLLAAVVIPPSTADRPRTRNLVLVTLDGVRVQEIFGGADPSVPPRSAEDRTALARFAGPTREARRLALMPFFWGTLMRTRGSIVGDPQGGRRQVLTNRHRISYPGYAELLTGEAHDDHIDSNDFGRNPHPSVLEVLRHRLGLSRSEVAVFASWQTMDRIAEHRPGTLFIDAGAALDTSASLAAHGVRRDEETFRRGLAHLHTYHPRVLYMGFDETDALAHEGRYGAVLGALNRADRRLEQLWSTLQADAFYRDRTALVVTVDHGRGRRPEQWGAHGSEIEGAEDVWSAFVVPESAQRGVWPPGPTIHYDQLAATLARLLGVDYGAARPQAGPPIEALFTR